RHSDRGYERELGSDDGADPVRHVDGSTEQERGPTHVEERLVEGQRLDERRDRHEHVPEPVRVRAVGLEVRRDEHGGRTKAEAPVRPVSRLVYGRPPDEDGRFPPGVAARSWWRRPSRRALDSAATSHACSAMTLTPRTPVRRRRPHTASTNPWKIVFAHHGWTRSNTVTSTGPVASSSVRKMIRWLLRTC